LLIVDEVQTGNGRTGQMYAYMNYGVCPDVVTTAKGLGGGLPIGACLLGEKVENIFGFGDHGSTFGGNPIACAGAVSILKRLDEAMFAEVREKGELIRSMLAGKPGIRSVSGLGLMIGIATDRPAAQVVKEGIEHGILCLTAKTKVRLLPALNIPVPILKEAIEILLEICAKKEEIEIKK
jgi:acetylornithine/N-succinyldiaminopimelate aminotransferase